MSFNYNNVLGLLCVIAGLVIVFFALGNILLRLLISIMALSLINYGLKLRGLPPLQVLIPLMANRKRWF